MAYESASFRVHMNSISQESGPLHTQETPSSVKHIFCCHSFLAASALPWLAIELERSSELAPNFEHGAGPTNIRYIIKYLELRVPCVFKAIGNLVTLVQPPWVHGVSPKSLSPFYILRGGLRSGGRDSSSSEEKGGQGNTIAACSFCKYPTVS
jgi:hypothetical protein